MVGWNRWWRGVMKKLLPDSGVPYQLYHEIVAGTAYVPVSLPLVANRLSPP